MPRPAAARRIFRLWPPHSLPRRPNSRKQEESAARTAEVAHARARSELDAARAPLAATERGVQRLETEAKTIGKLLAVENENLWPPVMDALSVTKGYEKALGAALGDDLDAPVDPSAPMHWAGAALDPFDPTLPAGVEPLSRFVKAPAELARRLAQIGVVERAAGRRLAETLKPGQRLVSGARSGSNTRTEATTGRATPATAARGTKPDLTATMAGAARTVTRAATRAAPSSPRTIRPEGRHHFGERVLERQHKPDV